MTRIRGEGCVNKLASHDVISLSFILHSFPVSATILKGESSFSMVKIQDTFFVDISKVQKLLLIKLIFGPNSVRKNVA